MVVLYCGRESVSTMEDLFLDLGAAFRFGSLRVKVLAPRIACFHVNKLRAKAGRAARYHNKADERDHPCTEPISGSIVTLTTHRWYLEDF